MARSHKDAAVEFLMLVASGKVREAASPARVFRQSLARALAVSLAEEHTMNHLQLTHVPVAKTGMLIRRPVAEVFEAFIDPAITTQFWFTRSSGRLEAGKDIKWDWEMYGASTRVTARSIERDKRILIEWDGYSGRTTVEWKFAPHAEDTTFVSITESGWTGNGDELLRYANESTQGFTWTLAGLKAFLEHNIRLNLVADRFPKGPQDPYPDQ